MFLVAKLDMFIKMSGLQVKRWRMMIGIRLATMSTAEAATKTSGVLG